MDTLLQDLRYAVRSLLRRPAFTVAALLTLGLGVGATTAIFSVVNRVLLQPLPYDEAHNLVMLGQAKGTTASASEMRSMSYPNFLDVREQTQSFESLALYTRTAATVTGAGDAESVPAAAVTADFFRVMRAEPRLGRSWTEEEDRPSGPSAVIVTHEYWQDRLGGLPDVLGRTLIINGTAHPIVGVLRPGFDFPRGSRLFLPAAPDPEACGRGCAYLAGVGRLAPGMTVAGAAADASGVSARLAAEYPRTNRETLIRVRSLMDVVVGDLRRTLYVMLGAVFMVLLIACANMANLLLVRGAGRASEFAVRAALGAGRGRLLRQLMTENVLLALVGGAFGIVLASWGVDLLRALAPQDLPRLDEITLDRTAVMFAGALIAFTALAFGLAPAARLSRGSLAGTLRDTGRGSAGPGRGWGRFAILVSEVALAVVLLLGVGLMLRSLIRMNTVETGFETEGIAHFSVGLAGERYDTPEKAIVLFDELKQRLGALPGADQVGLVLPMPLGPSVYGTAFGRVDQPQEEGRAPSALLRVADGNALHVLGVSLVRGRAFAESDRQGAPPVALINQALAEQYFAGDDPIGRQINVGVSFEYDEDQPRTIVGVVENIRALSLTEAPEPEIVVPFAQSVPTSMTVVIRTPDPALLLSAARAEVRALDADLALLRPGTMEELMAAQTASSRFFLLLLGVFALLALVLAAVGIYGVVAFMVARRRREIGVRMALGARIQEVVGLVVWQGVRPALVGLVLGLAGAVGGGRVLAGLLFDVQPHDLPTMAGVVGVLLTIVVLACAIPARRASRIPPASSLRSE